MPFLNDILKKKVKKKKVKCIYLKNDPFTKQRETWSSCLKAPITKSVEIFKKSKQIELK